MQIIYEKQLFTCRMTNFMNLFLLTIIITYSLHDPVAAFGVICDVRDGVCIVKNLEVLEEQQKVTWISSGTGNKSAVNLREIKVSCSASDRNNITHLPIDMIKTSNGAQKYTLEECPELRSLKEREFNAGDVALTQLFITKSGLEWIDDYGIEKLENLYHLDLSFNCLKDVRSKIFYGLLRLTYLNLSSNKIIYLQSDLFRYTTNLRILYLSKNRIDVIESDVLKLLPDLKLIYLERNSCINQNFDNNTIPGIEEIFLRDCSATKDESTDIFFIAAVSAISYLVLDLTLSIVVIIFHVNNRKSENNDEYVYSGFSFYNAPEYISSYLR